MSQAVNVAPWTNSAKPWTAENELNAFNIKIETLDSDDFFHACGLQDPPVSAAVLQNVFRLDKPIEDKQERLFFDYLDWASTTGEVAMTVDFTAFLLRWLGYDTQDRIVHQNKKAALTVRRERPDVYFDVCVTSPDRYYQLVVQAEPAPHDFSGCPAEPQLIANAIAAFHQNNINLYPALSRAVIPGIVMTGTLPTFYLIPVTSELVRNIEGGYRPEQPTVVYRCVAPIPTEPSIYTPYGMVHLGRRRWALQCLEAFKHFLNRATVEESEEKSEIELFYRIIIISTILHFNVVQLYFCLS